MRILSVLTYFRPHTSGLTIYAERLAQALVRRGHEVTILTSQFEKDLPLEEIVEGVRILRVPVLFRVSKGVIMPSLGAIAWRETRAHDALLLHLPQFDAAALALRGRLLKKPTVIIYHSDLSLPPGLFNRFVNFVVHFMNNLAARFTHKISAYTEDFANHSPFLKRYKHKVQVIAPAVEIPLNDKQKTAQFKKSYKINRGGPMIGMATRVAAEKGVELLLAALPIIIEKYPECMVLFAGQFENVLGEEEYIEKLKPLLDQYQKSGHWKFVGVLEMDEMAAFYANLDLIVVPSTNSTETFGFVQIEAMMNGKPSVASNLPGVRQPVKISGMGRVTPIGNSKALAENILAVLDDPKAYEGNPQQLRRDFSPDVNAQKHESMFDSIERSLQK